MPTPDQATAPGGPQAQSSGEGCVAAQDTRSHSMKDLVKETLLLGLGAALLTKEKIEDGLVRLVDEGRISVEEARRTAETIFEKGQGELQQVQEQLQGLASSALQRMDLASRSQIEELTRRLQETETRLQALDIRLKALEQQGRGPEHGSS